jgi:hypothetical protein
MLPPPSPLRVVVLMPLRDDWASAAELIRRLDQTISSYPYSVHVLLVDDGSFKAPVRRIFNAGSPRCEAYGSYACAAIWATSGYRHRSRPCREGYALRRLSS